MARQLVTCQYVYSHYLIKAMIPEDERSDIRRTDEEACLYDDGRGVSPAPQETQRGHG